jgi:cytochrome c peroxidase
MDAPAADGSQPAPSGVSAPPRSARQEYQVRHATDLADRIALGKRLFFDTGLSSPPGQSCASCHSPAAAFSDPDHSRPVSVGVLPGRVGTRNAPAVAYNSSAPSFGYDWSERAFYGGMFLDGRVADLAAQAAQPLLNPQEMHNQSKAEVVEKLLASPIISDLLRLYPLSPDELQGLTADKSSPGYATSVDGIFSRIGLAVTAYEISTEVNPYSSKYDAYLNQETELSDREMRGMNLFFGQACCSECHISTGRRREPGVVAPADRWGRHTLFSDFGYDNIGVPRNDAIAYPPGEPDTGLGRTLAAVSPASGYYEAGKFKAPTLRNVERTAPYGHNGYFKTLEEVVHFYNTRDVPSAGPRPGEHWPPPEFPHTMNRDQMGNLGLSPAQEQDIVAFLKTLTDGYTK